LVEASQLTHYLFIFYLFFFFGGGGGLLLSLCRRDEMEVERHQMEVQLAMLQRELEKKREEKLLRERHRQLTPRSPREEESEEDKNVLTGAWSFVKSFF
jgi:hypothetical protein